MSAPIEFEDEKTWSDRVRREAGLNVPVSTADAPKEVVVVAPAAETEQQWAQRMVREQQDRERAGIKVTSQPPVEPPAETLEEFQSKCTDYSPRIQPNKRIVR